MAVRTVYDWLDESSRQNFGAFPSYSYGHASHDENCQLLWEGDGGRQIWLQLTTNTLWASWPAPERADRMSLRGGTWKNTHLAAKEDFDIDLPEQPPEGFEHF